jgi:hypothetical protein
MERIISIGLFILLSEVFIKLLPEILLDLNSFLLNVILFEIILRSYDTFEYIIIINKPCFIILCPF